MHARGEVGIVIRKEFRGAGYAKDALTLLCEYAFDFLRMRQLFVHIATIMKQVCACLLHVALFLADY